MKKDNKQRLFEVMQRVAPDFTGKSLNESPVTTVTNDAGEPIGTENQPDFEDPQDDERQDGPERRPQGIGNFNNIDWQMLHEQLMINTELLAAGKTSEGNLMVANAGDFTDDEGMLSQDELELLDENELIYIHDSYPIIDDEKYKDFNAFKAKAQEIWNKETQDYNKLSSHGGKFESMYENKKKKRLFEVMQRVAPNFTGKALNEDSDFQQKINNGDIWLDHYGPSGSKEYTDGEIWYNRGGQQLRNPEEYNPHGDGYTPFGDEGDGMEEDFEQEETSEFLPITAPVGSPDDKLFTDIVNQGIDSHLEGFTKSKFEIKNASTGNRKVFNFHKSEIPILVRRLEELGTPEADQWADDIQNYDKNIQEIAENL